MSVADAISGAPKSFEEVREHLCHQYEKVPYEVGDGLAPAELGAELERYLAENPKQPRVIQAARAFELLLTRGQIWVDPRDWFVDKLNHGGLLHKLKRRWINEVEKELGEEGTWHEWAVRLGVVRAGIDTGHIAPGFVKVLSCGLFGLIEDPPGDAFVAPAFAHVSLHASGTPGTDPAHSVTAW